MRLKKTKAQVVRRTGVDLGLGDHEHLAGQMTNSDVQQRVTSLSRSTVLRGGDEQDQHQNQDQQLCVCGCGETVLPGRTFRDKDHQRLWLSAGGMRSLTGDRWELRPA